MSSEEYARWQAFFQVEGFGDRRQDDRIAQLGVLVASPYMKAGRSIEVKDLVFYSVPPPSVMKTEAEVLAMKATMMGAFGGGAVHR